MKQKAQLNFVDGTSVLLDVNVEKAIVDPLVELVKSI